MTTAEHIAIETLREILKLENTNPAVRIARKALETIDELPKVHDLSAVSLDVTSAPGGGA